MIAAIVPFTLPSPACREKGQNLFLSGATEKCD